MSEKLTALLERHQARRDAACASVPELDADDADVARLLEDLAKDTVRRRLLRDPYWPKWDGPWWHMVLLAEMNLAGEIPMFAIKSLVDVIQKHYLRTFPIQAEELPPGKDPYRHVLCHCALGSIFVLLARADVDLDDTLPWFRPWLQRYQLPDGGYNCDEAVYTRDEPHSSIVSTLPPLEALLFHVHRPTDKEWLILRHGGEYLLERQLYRSRRDPSRILCEEWLQPVFPRYYRYDILRGLRFLLVWAERLQRPLPLDLLLDVLTRLEAYIDEAGRMVPGRAGFIEEGTLVPAGKNKWEKKPQASMFPLLSKVSQVGVPSPYLTRQWYDCIERVTRLVCLEVG